MHRLAQKMIEGWHPALRRMVAESDPRTVIAVRIQTALPVERWESTNVTLLGDAIHTMTPLQGLGGNTALRDAGLLCRKLVEVAQARSELVSAIREYETEMFDYGFEAVRVSHQIAGLVVSDNRFGRAMFKTVLRAANALPALKHRMFRSRAAK